MSNRAIERLFFEECEAMASDSEVLAVADKVKEHTAPIMNAILRSVDDDKKGDVEDSVSEIAFYYQKALYEVGFRRAMLIILDVFSKGHLYERCPYGIYK